MYRYTAADVAEQLGVGVKRVYQAFASMEIGSKSGGIVLFSASDMSKIKERIGAKGPLPEKWKRRSAKVVAS